MGSRFLHGIFPEYGICFKVDTRVSLSKVLFLFSDHQPLGICLGSTFVVFVFFPVCLCHDIGVTLIFFQFSLLKELVNFVLECACSSEHQAPPASFGFLFVFERLI